MRAPGALARHFDQLGRLWLERSRDASPNLLVDDGASGIKVDRRYRFSGNNITADQNGRATDTETFAGSSAPGPRGAGGASTGIVDTAFGGGQSTTDHAGVAHTSTFDALGRLTAGVAGPYHFSYTYNADDSLATETYPSDKTLAFVYDEAGRPKSAAAGAQSYVSNAVYSPHGAPSSYPLGNGLTETTAYNSRLQPTQMAAGGLLTLDFTYGTTDNNGNVRTQTIAAAPVGLNVTQHYRYDGVNRLTIAAEGAQPTQDDVCPAGAIWCRDYAYDAFGNRAASGSAVGLGTPSSLAAFNSANNRLLTGSWAEYDASGNQTDFKYPSVGPCNQRFAEYDAENKMKAFGQAVNVNPTGAPDCPDVNNRVAIATYAYDGDGNRVQKVVGGETTTYVYDAFGRLAAEYSTAGPSGTGGIEFRTTDHLGSTRLVTDGAGAAITWRDFFPFGEEIPGSATYNRVGTEYNQTSGFAQQFTGQERDEESNLDYFGARYFGSTLGRFASPDAPFLDQDPIDPQSWSLYAYARSNPLMFVDPSGQTIDYADGYSKDLFDKYEQRLSKDPDKYKKELATIDQLKASKINYRIDATPTNYAKESTEGTTGPDGQGNIVIGVRNRGGATGERSDIFGRLAHELEHGRQFDSGETAYVNNNPEGNDWHPHPAIYEITDEVNAFLSQLNVSYPVNDKDNSLLKSLRGRSPEGIQRALSKGPYKKIARRYPNISYRPAGMAPGTVVRTPRFFGVVAR